MSNQIFPLQFWISPRSSLQLVKHDVTWFLHSALSVCGCSVIFSLTCTRWVKWDDIGRNFATLPAVSHQLFCTIFKKAGKWNLAFLVNWRTFRVFFFVCLFDYCFSFFWHRSRGRTQKLRSLPKVSTFSLTSLVRLMWMATRLTLCGSGWRPSPRAKELWESELLST